MTPLRNTAENATAGVPVVRGLDWLRQTDGILSRAETELGTYRVWTFAGARRWHWELSRGYQRFSGSAADTIDVAALVERVVRDFSNACTDWDGSQMADGEEPRFIPNCGYMREIATASSPKQARLPRRGGRTRRWVG